MGPGGQSSMTKPPKVSWLVRRQIRVRRRAGWVGRCSRGATARNRLEVRELLTSGKGALSVEAEAASGGNARNPMEKKNVETRQSRATTMVEWSAHIGIGAIFVILCSSPLLFGHSTFASDFTNTPWLAELRAQEIRGGGLFSYFVSGRGFDVLTPEWAFYGGPFITACALLKLLVGNVWLAFDVVGLGAWSMCYGGMYWLGRLSKLSRVESHFPAVVVVTSAYWITDAYGRGDWAEFVAISSLPLIVASGIRLVGSERPRVGVLVAFVVSAWVFTGTHLVTLLWGSMVLALCAVVLVLLHRRLPRVAKGAWWLSSAGVMVALTNVWYLVPAALYGNRTAISLATAAALAKTVAGFNSPSVLFNPLRSVPSSSTTPALYVQVPVLVLVVAAAGLGLIAVSVARRSQSWGWLRSTAGLMLVLGVVIATIVFGGVAFLPKPFSAIQFSYRLVAYASLLIGGVLLGVLRLTRVAGSRKHRRVLLGSVGTVVAMGIALACWQLWWTKAEMVGSLSNRSLLVGAMATNKPVGSFYAFGDYRSLYGPLVPKGTISGDIRLPDVRGVSGKVSISEPALALGKEVDTNLAAGPGFVRVVGTFRRIGHDGSGNAVLKVVGQGVHGDRLTLEVARTGLLAVLQWSSVVGFVGVVSVVGYLAVVRSKMSRGRHRKGRFGRVAAGRSSAR